jgi:hypothetical protein
VTRGPAVVYLLAENWLPAAAAKRDSIFSGGDQTGVLDGVDSEAMLERFTTTTTTVLRAVRGSVGMQKKCREGNLFVMRAAIAAGTTMGRPTPATQRPTSILCCGHTQKSKQSKQKSCYQLSNAVEDPPNSESGTHPVSVMLINVHVD